VEAVWRAFGGDLNFADLAAEPVITDPMVRQSGYLEHPIFHMNRAESEMTRYIRRLSDKDLALDRTMIPLGSCTMKLNATAEMLSITWPEFADIHPFAPADQALGYKQMIDDLSDKLCRITGYDAISMQPNSGAQGEYAGLMTIRAFHRANGEGHRHVCLIPTSAHGTNPASAQMAGMTVVAVGTRENGDIDLDDFRAKAELHSANLAACMITYPSTHGVFEERHPRGLRYRSPSMAGRSISTAPISMRWSGLARLGDFGADVCHMNLHKTFCIPHGGGGPGIGPIGVKAHLAPFLPGHVSEGSDNAVAAAAYGSASILPITWMYIRMMGADGPEAGVGNGDPVGQLHRRTARRSATRCSTRAARTASRMNASSTRGRLEDERRDHRRRHRQAADRLRLSRADHVLAGGGHADGRADGIGAKAELDRFCSAMLAIRAEAQAIEDGTLDRENNPLKNAPHTIEDLVGPWDRPYDREAACFPAGAMRNAKYFAPVNRVDNVYGDRHLVCSCPPMSDYAEAAGVTPANNAKEAASKPPPCCRAGRSARQAVSQKASGRLQRNASMGSAALCLW
jgi:glycine dehydrogenase